MTSASTAATLFRSAACAWSRASSAAAVEITTATFVTVRWEGSGLWEGHRPRVCPPVRFWFGRHDVAVCADKFSHCQSCHAKVELGDSVTAIQNPTDWERKCTKRMVVGIPAAVVLVGISACPPPLSLSSYVQLHVVTCHIPPHPAPVLTAVPFLLLPSFPLLFPLPFLPPFPFSPLSITFNPASPPLRSRLHLRAHTAPDPVWHAVCASL